MAVRTAGPSPLAVSALKPTTTVFTPCAFSAAIWPTVLSWSRQVSLGEPAHGARPIRATPPYCVRKPSMAPRSSLQRVGQVDGHRLDGDEPQPTGQRASAGLMGRSMEPDLSTISIRSGLAFRAVTAV